jgi:hypothetical protein
MKDLQQIINQHADEVARFMTGNDLIEGSPLMTDLRATRPGNTDDQIFKEIRLLLTD